MNSMTRSGLGFISGFLTLWGAYALQSNNEVVGPIAILLGISLFVYSYKERE